MIDVITPDRQTETFDTADITVAGWDVPKPGHIDIGLENAGQHRYDVLLDKADFDRLLEEAHKLNWL